MIKINYVKHPDSQLSKHDLRLSAQLLMVGIFSFYHGLQRGRAWKAGAESLVRSDRGCDIIAIWRREMLDGLEKKISTLFKLNYISQKNIFQTKLSFQTYDVLSCCEGARFGEESWYSRSMVRIAAMLGYQSVQSGL